MRLINAGSGCRGAYRQGNLARRHHPLRWRPSCVGFRFLRQGVSCRDYQGLRLSSPQRTTSDGQLGGDGNVDSSRSVRTVAMNALYCLAFWNYGLVHTMIPGLDVSVPCCLFHYVIALEHHH